MKKIINMNKETLFKSVKITNVQRKFMYSYIHYTQWAYLMYN